MDEDRADAIADHLGARGLRLSVAESLTGGMVSSSLAKAPGASSWLVGGKPPGTVWVGLCSGDRAEAHHLQLDGDPPTVCQAACDEALRLLEEHLGAV